MATVLKLLSRDPGESLRLESQNYFYNNAKPLIVFSLLLSYKCTVGFSRVYMMCDN